MSVFCLLTEGAGVYDVCEKEPTDAVMLTSQQKEDITTSAQV